MIGQSTGFLWARASLLPSRLAILYSLMEETSDSAARRERNWKTLEHFEAQLREDPAFRAKLDDAESDYLLARQILSTRMGAT